MRDVLVTGTDTGVGKTVIAAALVKALRARGVRAVGFKPLETGLDGAEGADSELLQRASGETAALAAPVLRLAESLAPAVAADRAGAPMHPNAIGERIELLRRAGYRLVVEGAGGVMVPLAWEAGLGGPFQTKKAITKEDGAFFYTVLDLAERCDLDAIIVARAGLGTLNHATMTAAMLRSRGIPIRGIVLNGGQSTSSMDLAETTNPAALARMLPDVRIISVPHHTGSDVVQATVPYLSELIP